MERITSEPLLSFPGFCLPVCSRCHLAAPGYDQLAERRLQFIRLRRIDHGATWGLGAGGSMIGKGRAPILRKARRLRRSENLGARDFFCGRKIRCAESTPAVLRWWYGAHTLHFSSRSVRIGLTLCRSRAARAGPPGVPVLNPDNSIGEQYG